jgi:ribosome-binding protein aMBF1 (putative translation factor)
MAKDFLAEVIAARSKKNPRFPDLVAEAEHRRALARALASRRADAGLSQTLVAARMGTAASVVSKLEAGADVKLSTLQRYCVAIGQTFPLRLGKRAA